MILEPGQPCPRCGTRSDLDCPHRKGRPRGPVFPEALEPKPIPRVAEPKAIYDRRKKTGRGAVCLDREDQAALLEQVKQYCETHGMTETQISRMVQYPMVLRKLASEQGTTMRTANRIRHHIAYPPWKAPKLD